MKTLALIALLLAGSATAAESAPPAAATAPCTGFAWPMMREIAAFKVVFRTSVPSGAVSSVFPTGATPLRLEAGGETSLPTPAERAPKPDTNSGYIVLPAPPAAGTYQVSLSAKAWIDVVQDGKHVKSGAHSSDANCPAIRKSVRFDLAAAPVTLQISGSDATSMVITILPAAD